MLVDVSKEWCKAMALLEGDEDFTTGTGMYLLTELPAIYIPFSDNLDYDIAATEDEMFKNVPNYGW